MVAYAPTKISENAFEEIAIEIHLKEKSISSQGMIIINFIDRLWNKSTIYEPLKSSFDIVNRKVFINKDVSKAVCLI